MFALSIRCLKISVYQYITMVYWYSDIYTVLENIRISMYHNFCNVIQKPCHHQRNSSVNTNWVKSSIALAKTDPGEAKRTKPDGPVSWTHPYCVRSPQWPPPSTQAPSSFSWSHSLPPGFHLRADKPHKYWYLWNMCPQVFLVLWLFCRTLFSILFPSPLLKGICSVGSSYK